MSWLPKVSYPKTSLLRTNTDLQKVVYTNFRGCNALASNFSSIFDNFIGFRDEMSAVRVYPFSFLYINYEEDNLVLHTTKLVVPEAPAKNIKSEDTYLNLGEYHIERKFNNFLDYNGYTYIKIYLPFVGYVDIDTNECMDKWLQIRLSVDYLSGEGTYLIGVTESSLNYPTKSFEAPLYPLEGFSRVRPVPYGDFDRDLNIRVIATYKTHIGMEVPMGTSNIGEVWRNVALGMVKAVGTLALATYVGTLPPPTTTETSSSVVEYDIQGRGSYKGARMRQVKSGTETTTTTTTTVHRKPVNMAKPFAETADGSLTALANKFSGGSSDRVNDSASLLNTAYEVHIIIYRPKVVSINQNYEQFYGKPLGQVVKLQDLAGFTSVSAIHFEGEGFETITQSEIAMLEEAFTQGVIL